MPAICFSTRTFTWIKPVDMKSWFLRIAQSFLGRLTLCCDPSSQMNERLFDKEAAQLTTSWCSLDLISGPGHSLPSLVGRRRAVLAKSQPGAHPAQRSVKCHFGEAACRHALAWTLEDSVPAGHWAWQVVARTLPEAPYFFKFLLNMVLQNIKMTLGRFCYVAVLDQNCMEPQSWSAGWSVGQMGVPWEFGEQRGGCHFER